MVAVLVDRPLGDDHVGPLGLQDFAEFVEVRRVEDCLAVDLPRIGGARLQNLARLAGLLHADVGGSSPLRRRPLAVVQVKEDDLVTELVIARNGSAATVLRIAGVPTGDNDFQFARALFLWVWLASTRDGQSRKADGQSRPHTTRAG